MVNREPISKKIRFEVFKRDSFTCQYCGRSAPGTILEVDHIEPVCEGGTSEILNLITSCFDCNRGKGKRKLSDDAVMRKQVEGLKELNAKREQLEMMFKWKINLTEMIDDHCEYINNVIEEITGFRLNQKGFNKLKVIVKKYGFSEVLDSVEISVSQYYVNGNKKSFEIMFNKLGGILYNRSKGINHG